MIKEIQIKNFKSINDITLHLGRFNILIGSNGSGKSNILEAIAFAGAASADKLDNEFLGSRGIRTSSARLMKNAFNSDLPNSPIELRYKNNKDEATFTIQEDSSPVPKWLVKEKEETEKFVSEFFGIMFSNKMHDSDFFNNLKEEDKSKFMKMRELSDLVGVGDSKEWAQNFFRTTIGQSFQNQIFKESIYNEDLANFIIYSPEISALRKFEEESQIKPLGIKGEGLFNVLQIFSENYGEETVQELKEHLQIIEWFQDFDTLYDMASNRRHLAVRDRYMLHTYLNQNNVNEGFLFLMFYISLMLSKETPTFFAIDNVEASFHPRLCEELIKNLVKLSKKHNKQVILTTHNPFVLDGLNLNDPDQALFVVRRNSDGETITDKIDKQPKNVKLSEAWMRGYIGGQPETIN